MNTLAPAPATTARTGRTDRARDPSPVLQEQPGGTARWSLGDRFGVAAVCLLVAVASAPLMIGGTLVGQDSAGFFYPMFSFLGERLRDGDIPAWNPHQFAGAPFAGDPESGWMYVPAMLLFGLLPLEAAIETFVVFHLALAAFAAYGLARLLGIGAGGAVVSAAVASLNGLTYGRSACCPAYLEITAWVPPLLLAAEFMARARAPATRLRAWAVAGFALSQALAAWIGQGAGYAMLAFAGYLAYRTLIDPPGDRAPLPARFGRLALDGAVVLGLGLTVAAAGLLPRFAFHADSILSEGYTGDLAWAADLGGWTTTEAAGRLFGRGLNYVGGSVAVLALVGLLLARRRFAVPFWAVLSAGVLLLSTEQSSPIHALPRLIAPPFAELHAHWPERSTVIFYLGPALLAGAGVTMLGRLAERTVVSRWPGRSAALVMLGIALALVTALPLSVAVAVTLATVGGLVAALGLALAGSRGRQMATMALILVVTIDLLAAGRYALANDQWYGGFHKVDLDAYYDPAGAAAFLQQRQAVEPPFRFFGYDPTITYVEDPTHGELALYRYQYADPRTTALVVNNRATLFGLYDVQGYNPLQSRRYVELIEALNGQPQEYHGSYVLPNGLDSPILDLLNARYLIVPANPPPGWPGPGPGSDDFLTVYADDEVRVLQRPATMSSAWIVHEARQVEPGGALALLAGGDVDARRLALLEDTPPVLAPPVNPDADAASVVIYEPDRMVVETRTDAPGLLVLSEVWDDGWTATVDGARTDVYVADHALRAVAIPAGVHTVELRYEPATLRTGLAVSGAGIAALAAMFLTSFWLSAGLAVGSRRRREMMA